METLHQRLHRASVRVWTERPIVLDLKTIYVYSGWAVLYLLVAADLLTEHIAQFGLIGTALRYLTYVYVLIFVAGCLRDLLTPLWPLKAPLTVFFIAFYVAILAINMTDLRSMSGETAGETGCAVNVLLHAADHGFRQTCLYGYPARQFFLPAVPTLLFGRTILDLNLGGSFYILIGIIVFATSVIRYFGPGRARDVIAGIFLVSLLHIYYFNHFLLVYEQSLYPLAFGLMGAGLFLLYRAQRDDALIMLGGIVLLYLIHAYTPALAIYALGVLVLAYLAITDQVPGRDKIFFVFLILLSLASFRLSLGYRTDINLGSKGAESMSSLVQDVGTAFDHLVFLNHGTPFLSPVLTFPFIVFMVSALLFLYGRGPALIAAWAVVAIVFAVISHGYEYYGVSFRLHRSMVIFPILFATAAVILARYQWNPVRVPYLGAVLLVLALTGFKFHLDYRNSVPPGDHLAFLDWMGNHVVLTHKANHPASVYFYSGSYYTEFFSLNDEMRYYYPQLTGTELNGVGSGHNCLAGQEKIGVFVVPTSDPCYGVLKRHSRSHPALVSDGVYTDLHGERFGVFERD